MRRAAVVAVIAVLAACNGTEQELAPTTTPPAPETTTTTMMVPASSTTTTGETTTTPPPATTTTLAPLQSLAYEEIAAVEFPTQLVEWDNGLSLVSTKDGRLWVMEPDGEIRPSPVLDISDQVQNEGERGLLSILVSEDRASVYAHYSGAGGDTVVSRFSWADGVLGEEQVLFEHDQPAGNHNGGMLAWGPDGLYLGLGDGGGSNDAFGNGQNPNSLMAGIVRIDVGHQPGEPVKWQAGLRNPWRFWIDVSDELIYIADVGQNAYEEINVAGLEEGLNYGWPITEGLHCFQPSSGCDTDGLTLPAIEVEHGDAGTCSITGGVIYRGEAIPELNGHYFYSDYCGGYLRSFLFQDGEVAEETDWTDQVGVPGGVVSFGMDFFGEMYVLTTDRILKVVPVRAG